MTRTFPLVAVAAAAVIVLPPTISVGSTGPAPSLSSSTVPVPHSPPVPRALTPALDGPGAGRTVSDFHRPPVGAEPVRPHPHPRLSLVTAAARTETGAVRAALPDAALAIRWCESRDDYQAENPTSSASGAWQFIDATWTAVTGLEPPASAYPREVQDRAALALYDDGRGASHWNASRACWAPMVADLEGDAG